MASKRGLVAREHESLAAIDARPQRPRLTEIWIVWALFGLATVAVFETYWRIPPQELWKVHNSGFVGRAGRPPRFRGVSPAPPAPAGLPTGAGPRGHRAAARRPRPRRARRAALATAGRDPPSAAAGADGGCPRADAGLRLDEHGERPLDRAGRQARLDELAGTGRPLPLVLTRLGGDARRRRGDLRGVLRAPAATPAVRTAQWCSCGGDGHLWSPGGASSSASAALRPSAPPARPRPPGPALRAPA